MNTPPILCAYVKYSLLIIALIVSYVNSAFTQDRYSTPLRNVQGAAQDYSWENLRNLPGFFPILPWDPQHGFRPPYVERKQGIETIAACNFTMAGFVQPQDFARCEDLNIAAFILHGDGLKRAADWKQMSETQIDEAIRSMITASGKSRSLTGYFITDEPGASAFPALAAAVRAVRKYAPGKLAYINLFPNYATLGARDKSQLESETYAEYLERFVNEVKPDLISYDNYMVQYSNDLGDAAKAESYYTNLLEVRRVALKYDLPFWNIVSSNQIRPFTTVPSPANLLFQAYTTLAAGGTGVTWYTYYARGYGYAPVDENDAISQTWYYLKEVNRQVKVIGPIVKTLISTGVYFSSPAPVPGLPELPGRIVREIAAESPVMVGEFKDGSGDDFVMVVNLNLGSSVKCDLVTEPEQVQYTMHSSADGRLVSIPKENGIWLTAGEGKLLKINRN